MYHKVIIVGNLGQDPDMRFTPSGVEVANFPVATNRRYTASNGEKINETVWFRVSTWGKMAQNCHQYLRKGRKVLVEGRLIAENGSPRVWEDRNGNPRASFEISAINVQFLSGRDEIDETPQPNDFGESSEMDEDLPF